MTAAEKREEILLLKKKIDETKAEYDRAKAMQLALKLALNGTYGAFAHPKFVLSNSHIANSITAMGRDVIQYMLGKIENYFYKEWPLDFKTHTKLGIEYIAEKDGKYFLLDRDGENINYSYDSIDALFNKLNILKNQLAPENKKINDYNILYCRNIHNFSNILEIPKEKPIIIYGDTDSVFSKTIINTNNGDFTIEELYNKNISEGSAGITLKGHESVNCKEKVLNWNEKLYYAPVKRIIRHKVSKAKWKLKTKSGKEIIVTNDHSMIVFRDGKKLEVKPSEILKTDKILIIKNET